MASTAFIRGIPKAELHVHLEGCLTPQLAQRLADRNNMPLPESVSKATTAAGLAFDDMDSFLQVYYAAITLLQTEQDFHDLAWDYLLKAKEQNIRYCELFFGPQVHTSRNPPVPFTTVLSGLGSALTRAKAELDITARLILGIARDHSIDSALATMQTALDRDQSHAALLDRHVIGLGLEGDECDNPPSKFAAVYDQARSHDWHLTCHCDIDQPNTLTHIEQALVDLRVDRIDHGTKILGSPDLIACLIARNASSNARSRSKATPGHGPIGLTCCPISNSIVTSVFKGAEILALLRHHGVKVTINSDDPAYFRAYLVDNLAKMVHDTDMTRAELVTLVKNAFEVAWMDDADRDAYLKEVDDFVRAF